MEEAFKRNRSSWKICENILVIAVNDKNLGKLCFAVENLYNLKAFQRVKPPVYAKIIEFYLEIANNYMEIEKEFSQETQETIKCDENKIDEDGLNNENNENAQLKESKIAIMKTKKENLNKDLSFYKRKIFNIFETYSVLDGTQPEIWDLYVFFIDKVELSKKNLSNDEKNVFYKQIIEVRMKQIRCLTTSDWELSQNKFPAILKACDNVETEIQKLPDLDKDYISQVKDYLFSLRDKISILSSK